MKPSSARAPAKINLTLHVTGQRADGYHLLDSLVVFADACDVISAQPASDLTLRVTGPFAEGVPVDGSNLVLRAAQALRRMRGVIAGAALVLDKQLPHAAGIGSGSSDAAATLQLLADFWGVAPLDPLAAEVLALGADVPVCMRSPSPTRMRGIGDMLADVPTLPDCAFVLVNPKVPVPTGAVFQGLPQKDNPGMAELPEALDFAGLVAWVAAQRNDLQAPAELIAPEVGRAIKRLKALPAVSFAGMSGSGATCFALVRDMAAARQVARAVQVAEMGWWVIPAPVMRAV